MSNKLNPKTDEEEEIYKLISDSLLQLCEQKPNDPQTFLSKKMFELIGDDPENAIRTKKDIGVIESQRKLVKKATLNNEALIDRVELAYDNLDEEFKNHYKVISKICRGVLKVQSLFNENEIRVAKILLKKRHPGVLLDNQLVKMLCSLDHPCIVKIYDIFEDKHTIRLIEDFCPGSDLASFLFFNKDKITIDLLKEIMRQIISGVIYIHNSGIIHRNINFSKLIIFNASLDPREIRIKLSGFTNAERCKQGDITERPLDFLMHNHIFLAPEYKNKKYTNKVDIWSIGIIAYYLFLGQFPFPTLNREVAFQVLFNDIVFPKDADKKLVSFLKLMLKKDPSKRKEASELIEDEFLKEGAGDFKYKINISTLNLLSGFKIGETLRRSVLSYIISRKLYNEKDIELIKLFEEIDVNHDGKVDITELYSKCSIFFGEGSMSFKMKKVKKLMELVDINHTGGLEYSEFLTIMTIMKTETNKATLKQIFDYYDANHQGYIATDDLKRIFADSHITDEEFYSMLDEYDMDDDRKISFEEFLQLVLLNPNENERQDTEEGKKDSEINGFDNSEGTYSNEDLKKFKKILMAIKDLITEECHFEVEDFLNAMDTEKNGFITVDNFKAFIQNNFEISKELLEKFAGFFTKGKMKEGEKIIKIQRLMEMMENI
ncbi:MAG: protein kinase [archaeon]|nr:protein kinase [archaeon]